MASPDAPTVKPGLAGHESMEERERRRPLLVAALSFALLEPSPEPVALTTPKGWLDSWAGIGAVIAGMTRLRREDPRRVRMDDG